MALGLLALGGKTQAGQAGNSQRSEEGMLPYGSPIRSKVPGGFLEALHQGHSGLKGSARADPGVAQETGTIWAPSGAVKGQDPQKERGGQRRQALAGR